MKNKKAKKPLSKPKKIIKTILIILLVIVLIPVVVFGSSAIICTALPGKEAAPETITNPYISLDKTFVSATAPAAELPPKTP